MYFFLPTQCGIKSQRIGHKYFFIHPNVTLYFQTQQNIIWKGIIVKGKNPREMMKNTSWIEVVNKPGGSRVNRRMSLKHMTAFLSAVRLCRAREQTSPDACPPGYSLAPRTVRTSPLTSCLQRLKTSAALDDCLCSDRNDVTLWPSMSGPQSQQQKNK